MCKQRLWTIGSCSRIAQNHGLATRLLDWTRSPLAALYFCVCKEVETRDDGGRR
ncbi:MAG: FRG domain-containing protein [Bryobacteraceae bacterium]|nr:FRG domain-containing protein [Bryobacteraceae bacterium]